MELPEDFWIPVPLNTDNITHFSPFLVPQDHLGSTGIFYGLSAFMFVLFVTGTAINVLTVMCTIQYKKLRSHLNYILVNMAVANLLVSSVGSFTCFFCFASRYMIAGPLGCKIEGFLATLGGKTHQGPAKGTRDRCICASFDIFLCEAELFLYTNQINPSTHVSFN